MNKKNKIWESIEYILNEFFDSLFETTPKLMIDLLSCFIFILVYLKYVLPVLSAVNYFCSVMGALGLAFIPVYYCSKFLKEFL